LIFIFYKIKNRGKKLNEVVATLSHDEKKVEIIKQKESIVHNNIVDYLTSISKVSADNTQKLTNDEVGRMGECFIEFCVKKKIRYFKKNLFVAVKKIFPEGEVEGIK
jgi:hypothetical protein